MIDTDKYEETDHPELVEFEGETLGDTLTNLLAEVKRLRKLRKQLEDCKRQIQFTADWIRDRGEDTHAKELDEFLEWME